MPANPGLTNENILATLGGLRPWARQCHAAAIHLVQAEITPANARVARGWCSATQRQHSWIALGDPYDEETDIIDPTIWSYAEGLAPWIARGTPAGGNLPYRYQPHGAGEIRATASRSAATAPSSCPRGWSRHRPASWK